MKGVAVDFKLLFQGCYMPSFLLAQSFRGQTISLLTTKRGESFHVIVYTVFLLSGGLHVADRYCVLTLSSKRCYNLYDTLFITFFLPILRWYHDMRFYFLVTEEKALATL